MSKIISYSLEEILKFKNVNINILTEELSNCFDNINNSFLQSTQYLENCKKINYNQINSSKWKKINSNINTKLLSLLNRITDETFSNVLEKILNSEITSHKQLEKLSNDIYSKIINDNNNNNNRSYCLIIKQIIDSGIWYYKDIENTNNYLNLRYYFINKLNVEFDDCLKLIDLIKEKYETDENAFFSIKNKCNVIINTIINLHSSNILSNEIMNYVIDSLITKYSDTTQDVIEYLCTINKVYNYEDVEKFLIDLLKNNKLQSRYKFMIEDINKKPIVKEVKVNVNDEYKKFLTDANLDSLKKHVGGKINYLELLSYVFDKLLSVNLNEIEKYLNLIKKIKERMNKDEYNTYVTENFNEFVSELPILSKYKDRIM